MCREGPSCRSFRSREDALIVGPGGATVAWGPGFGIFRITRTTLLDVRRMRGRMPVSSDPPPATSWPAPRQASCVSMWPCRMSERMIPWMWRSGRNIRRVSRVHPKDPQNVGEYVKDIYSHMLSVEAIFQPRRRGFLLCEQFIFRKE